MESLALSLAGCRAAGAALGLTEEQIDVAFNEAATL